MKKTDAVLQQADALIKRHRSFVAGGAPPASATGGDVPTLTDIVTPEALLNEISNLVTAVLPESADVQQVEALIATYFEFSLSAMQAQSTQLVESWLARELPRILSHEVNREMAGLSGRIAAQVLAEFRATVLPQIGATGTARQKSGGAEDQQ